MTKEMRINFEKVVYNISIMQGYEIDKKLFYKDIAVVYAHK